MEKKIDGKTVKRLFCVIMGTLIMAFLIGLFTNPTGDQLNIFFLKMNDLFADFFNVLIGISEKNPYFNENKPAGFGSGLPLDALLLYPFSCLDSYSSMTLQDAWASKIGLMSCILLIILSLAFFYFFLYKLGKSKKSVILILILFFFSYINLFAIERGNLIIFSAALVTAFLFLYDSPEKKYRLLALFFISIASVLKVYPALFGLLLLIDKKYKSVVVCIITGLTFAFVPFLFLQHGFGNVSQMFKNMETYTDVWSVELMYPRFGLSHLVYWTSNAIDVIDIRGLIGISRYIMILLSIFSVILCFLAKSKQLKIALLAVIVILFPSGSGLYTGLYFFPVIILFFNKPFYTKKDLLYVLLFCLFLNPFQICIKGFSINYILANISILSIWMLLLLDVLKEIKGADQKVNKTVISTERRNLHLSRRPYN
jgi:hypothetical protein